MTDAERQALNERIALEVGWHYYPKYNSAYRWHEPYGKDAPKYYHENPPDFTRKWEHAGPLLVELCQEFDDVTIEWFRSGDTSNTPQEVRLFLRNDALFDTACVTRDGGSKDEDLTEAIAVAFDAWKGSND